MSADKMTGHCLCGAVSFEAEGVELAHHVCHCGSCRRWSGGPVFTAIVAGVTFKGEDHIQAYNSSEWAERGFCRTCGSGLFYRLKDGRMMLLNVGLFDDAEAFHIKGEIYVDCKPGGYAFAGDHERLTEAEFLASIQAGPA